MNSDLAIDEMIAAALPQDYVEDMWGAICRNTCERCNHTFIGRVSRVDCKVCAPPKEAES